MHRISMAEGAEGAEYRVLVTYGRYGRRWARVQLCEYKPGDEGVGLLIGVGFAQCSEKDTFDRTVGRTIAMLRAMDNARLRREDRLRIMSWLEEVEGWKFKLNEPVKNLREWEGGWYNPVASKFPAAQH